MTKFKSTNGGFPTIVKIEIDRQTASCVWVNGRQYKKQTDYECYWDTFEQAHECLIEWYQYKLDSARRSLQHWQDKMGNVKGLKRP